jgi:hypothetical protein
MRMTSPSFQHFTLAPKHSHAGTSRQLLENLLNHEDHGEHPKASCFSSVFSVVSVVHGLLMEGAIRAANARRFPKAALFLRASQ